MGDPPAESAAGRGPQAHGPLHHPALAPWLTGAVAFVVYWTTAAPTIGFGDSPELSAAARVLGVPHPTGYPLLMLLGHGFGAVLAVGDPAWRLNVLTALLAAIAVGWAAAFAARASGRPLAGWVAGSTLAFTPSYWSNATLFEVYALHLALLAALLWLWIRYEQQPSRGRLRALVVVAGLASTHHLMVGLVLPVLAVAVLRHWRRFAAPAELARLLVLFVLPFGVLAYLPWAALSEPVVNWGDPSSALRFWSHVTGRQYHGNLGGDADAPWWSGAADFLSAGAAAPMAPLGLLAAIGALAFVARPGRESDRVVGVVLLAIFAVGIGFGSFYGVVDREPFFLNATLAAALLAGLGAAAVLERIRVEGADAGAAVVVTLALLPVVPGVAHFRDQDRSDDYAAHDRALAELSILPRDAVLITQGFEGYPAVYASLVEGLRPDVLVVDHYLRVRGDGGGYGAELERIRHRPGGPGPLGLELTVAAVAARLGRPLFLTRGVPDYDWSEIGLARVQRGIVDQLVPVAAAHLPAGDVAEEPMAAFRGGPVLLSAGIRPGRLEPGDVAPITLRWRWPAGEPAAGLTVTVVAGDEAGRMLEDGDGEPLFAHAHALGQGVPLDAETAAAGWLESVALALPRALPPGSVSLFLALGEGDAYRPTADDRVFVRIGGVDVAPRTRSAWRLAPGPDPVRVARAARAR